MDVLDLIRDHLTASRDLALSKIEDMAEHATVHPTPHGGAHTLWLLGHLAYIEGLVIRQFMLGEENPLADWEPTFDGAEVSSDAGDYPPFEEVLTRCRGMRAGTLELLGTLSHDDLDRVSARAPEGHEAMFGTYGRCLHFVGDHWYMHRGQLADARRASGVDRMWL